MLDISESGKQIGEKLFAVLNARQQEELAWYILESEGETDSDGAITFSGSHSVIEDPGQPLTEIRDGDLYFCLEQRYVSVRGQEIELTAKEFDILTLLIENPKRVFTYEMIMDIVWHEDYDYYSRKAINNHVSNLRRKLKISPDIPDYIKSVHCVGYKFEG